MDRIGVNVVLVGIFLWLVCPARVTTAEETTTLETEDRWLPSVSFFTMGLPEERGASLSSDTRGTAESESTGFAWSVGGGLELASPELSYVPGHPRFFAHGDLAWATEVNDNVVSDGTPGEPALFGTVPVVSSIEGVGQELRATVKPLLLTGGVGFSFDFEAYDRQFRIRPSLEWMYQRQTLESVLGSGENEVAGGTCGPCRLLFIQNQKEKGFHSLGPGIEIEAEASRSGNIQSSFFAGFRVYRILGDRDTDAGGVGAWQRTDGAPTTRPNPETRLRALYERKPWHYRFGFGIRLYWLPD